MFVLIEEADAESTNVYLFNKQEEAQLKLAKLRDEWLDGEDISAQAINTPDQFYEDSGYWLRIEEQTPV